jgi:RNA recognition motif-containing protein
MCVPRPCCPSLHLTTDAQLDWSTTRETLARLCAKYGAVVEASVALEDSGRSKGWGTVLFTAHKDAAAAVRGLDGASVDGRKVEVRLDKH